MCVSRSARALRYPPFVSRVESVSPESAGEGLKVREKFIGYLKSCERGSDSLLLLHRSRCTQPPQFNAMIARHLPPKSHRLMFMVASRMPES